MRREYPLWLWWLPRRDSLPEKTQKTQPKGTDEFDQAAKPMDMPEPKRKDLEDALDQSIGAKADDEWADA